MSARGKTVHDIFVGEIRCRLRESTLPFQLFNSLDEIHLLKLSAHQLLLKIKQAIVQLEHSFFHNALVTDTNKSLAYFLNRISARHSACKPIKHLASLPEQFVKSVAPKVAQ
ncbi:hypothetical protein SAMN05216588_12618 [Pseudomonas flavescens]|uniref:Uncharacterized protein n=1 Tax=Phytopseudomonas flavescens TaxID=29435 RepID=A0A1G8NUB9_9GAMM|nr:hypothetical protein SAMN05216588_12618 [Pseudomonas flavescens]